MTTAVILQIIVGIGGLLTLWARDYFSTGSVAERKEKVENAAIQKGRTDSKLAMLMLLSLICRCALMRPRQ